MGVKLPYYSRNPRAFERIARKLLSEPGDCGLYTVDCSEWRDARIELREMRVYDRLSGLRLKLRIPVIVFRSDGRECRVEAVWDGTSFRLECRSLEACCKRVTRGP